jgi:hypothetical protein
VSPGQVPDAVVDRLEVVDVDGEQCDVAVAAAGVEDDFAKHLLEAATVEASRQRVGKHHRRELGSHLIVRTARAS